MQSYDVTQKLLGFLEANKVKFQTYFHPACRTSVESSAARQSAGAPEAIGAKALLVKMNLVSGEEKFYLLILPGPLRIDEKLLKATVPNLKRFRFAYADELGLVLDGLVPGSVPPFGNIIFSKLDDMIIDQKIFDYPYIGFNAGCLEKSIVMEASEYRRISTNILIADFAK